MRHARNRTDPRAGSATAAGPARRIDTGIVRRPLPATSGIRQRGFSLVELAAVLMVLGLVTLALVQFLGTAAQERREVVSRDLLQRADDALLTYAMINSRLPCPASDDSGVADCGSGQVGRLPYKEIGLPDARARLIRYGVLRRPDSPTRDADLGDDKDRFYPMNVFGDTGTLYPLGNPNGLDLCWALRNAQLAPDDDDYLHVTSADTASGIAHVAYALALPRGGDLFGGEQVDDDPSFDSPRRPDSPDFHDHVIAVGLDQMWSRMHCGDNLSAAGFAHFRAAATIQLMLKSLKDYQQQLAVTRKMAEANVLNAGAAVASGAAGVAEGAGGVADTVSEGLASSGVVTYRVALGAVTTAAAVAVTIGAAAMLADAEDSLDAVEDAHSEVGTHIEAAEELQPVIREHAETADAVGLY